jgi:5-methylcytosine-specific restriction endonuclease McrA
MNSYKEKVKDRLINGNFKKEKERFISEAVRSLDCEIENVKDAIKKKANPSDEWFVELKFDTLIELKIEEIKLLKSWIDDSGYSFKELQVSKDKKEDYKDAWKVMLKTYGKFSNHNMNNFIVDEMKLTVCPYCNRNYVNNLSKNKASAQLDHFIDKSTYPIFALSLYNLIPCCQACNHSKSGQEIKGSPYDVDANNDNIIFSYNPITADFVNNKEDLEVIVKAVDE